MSSEVQKGASTGKKPNEFYLLHHPISFLYSFFQKTLMKEKVKEKGQRVFLLVLSLFPILHSLFKFIFKLEYNCFTMLLVSAVQQCESAISIHISPPSWVSLPPA